MKTITLYIILFILIILLIYILYDNYEHMTTDITLQYSDPKINLRIYQMLKDIDELFTINDIEYWIDGGTLLGAIRHKGLIPWDDDADIEIDESNINKLLKLRNKLDELGYTLVDCWFGFKIYLTNGKIIENYEWRYPFVDIFVTKKIDNKHIFSYQRAIDTFGTECNFTDNELYPLKRYKFGEIYLNGPNNPIPGFNRYYGSDWNDITYKTYDHEFEKSLKKVKIKLTDEMRNCAQPMGPLLNRILIK